ncbi:hypothetical protein LINGRAHAP2_LOCUS17036 [Linum grandiflorum]
MGSMAMPTQERSKPLHNFSLPYLKWGNQRVLRCVKIPPPPPPPPPHHHHHRQQSSAAVVVNGAIQSRPTIQNPVQQRPSSSNPDLGNGDESSPPPSRPWNLRTRRAACKAPGVRGAEEKGVGVVVSNNNNNHFNESGNKRGAYWEIESSPAAKRQCLESPPPMMTMKERVNNRKLCVPLTRDEIEEDFMEIARMRPPRRPKKRPRIVQKYMDLMFPGLWLTEVTTDLYKVPEVPES